MSTINYGDYQNEIYTAETAGRLPAYPVDFPSMERTAAEALPSFVYSYVAGGCGDGSAQRANVEAFSQYAITPRMLVGADHRDLSVKLLDIEVPSSLFLCPIGLVGLCSQDFHGDIHTAQASARTGVPMIASTLSQDPMEDVAAHTGDTPALFQLYPRTTANWRRASGGATARSRRIRHRYRRTR